MQQRNLVSVGRVSFNPPYAAMYLEWRVKTNPPHCVRQVIAHGKIANALAGKPRPSFTFGHVTTMSAPLAGTWSRFAITSI